MQVMLLLFHNFIYKWSHLCYSIWSKTSTIGLEIYNKNELEMIYYKKYIANYLL